MFMGEFLFKRVVLGFLFIVGLFFLVVFMKNSGYSLFGESSSVSQENDASHVNYLNSISGYAVHPLYSSFSSPGNGFGFNNSNGLVSVSDTAVYRVGYYSINGSGYGRDS